MKDLGKNQSVSSTTTCTPTMTCSSSRVSPKQDLDVIEIFHKQSSPNGSNKNGGNGDQIDRVMDKHLSDLEHENLTDTVDIAKYMANLKEKHLESQQQQAADSSLSPEPQTIVENTIITAAEVSSPPRHESDSSDRTTERSEEDSEDNTSSSMNVIVIDKKVDKVFKSKSEKSSKTGESSKKSSSSKSPRSSIHLSHSPDRSKSQGSSPVRIIRVKSPKSSSDQEKRLSVSLSRDSSQDRLSGGRRTPSPRRASEGGILKRPQSPRNVGILKPSQSPCKARSPERSCLKKQLTPSSHECSTESRSPHLSPRSSVEYLSPDRSSSCRHHGQYTPRSSFDSRCSESNLDVPRPAIRSPRGSFDYRADTDRQNGNRKRSLSAHGSFDTTRSKSPEPHYQYYPIYDHPRPPTNGQYSGSYKPRLSKSLERSTSRESTSSSTYRYGVSPEHIYTIDSGPIRSQSAENAFAKYGSAYDSARSNESLARALEHPTCVECLYQRKPS